MENPTSITDFVIREPEAWAKYETVLKGKTKIDVPKVTHTHRQTHTQKKL